MATKEQYAKSLSTNKELVPLSSTLGWAGWSPWTSCSKTCGGGVSQQLRRCLDVKCSGFSIRFRVCNLMECDKPNRSTRDTICSGEIIVSKQQFSC
uniref:ADAM_CR_2 domain-containing protein n=1 Tax=Heterorhabditis bacteriophora TaxID=37862 RepID=A0A1I7W7J3_HETBA